MTLRIINRKSFLLFFSLISIKISTYAEIDRIELSVINVDTTYKMYNTQNSKPFDFALGINIGFGVRMNSGQIRNIIDEGIVLNLGANIIYNKWNYNLYILVGPVQIQRDISVSNKIWAKGSDGNYLNCELSIGYKILGYKSHNLLPSLGIALTQLSPYQETINNDPYYKNIHVNLRSLVLGVNYQYKYSIKKLNFYYPPDNLGCISIRYALSYQITGNNLYKGLVNYIILTWQFEVHR